jgi:CheY-like chemotaxis protein
VDSELGCGSTFMLSLPKRTQSFNKIIIEEIKIKRDGIILVIDDDIATCDLLQKDLSKLGYAVAIANNSFHGIKLAYKIRPDAILIGVKKHEMEKCQNLRNLKNESRLSHIPLIMIAIKKSNQSKYATVNNIGYIDKTKIHSQLPFILDKYQIGIESKKFNN